MDGITDSVDMSLNKLWDLLMERKPGVLQSMGLQRIGHSCVTELTEQLYCLVMLMVKIQPVMQEDARDRVPSLGKEDLLE